MTQKRKLIYFITTLTLISILLLTNTVEANSTLNLTTTKAIYNLGEKITITGNLTIDGTPVTDAIITIQILNPRNETIALRSALTGTNPSTEYVPIEVIDFYPCDINGKPTYSFKRGSNAGFKIRVKNNAAATYSIVILIYIQFANDVPFTIFPIYNGTIEPNREISAFQWPVPIPSDAPLGTTKAYANVIDKYPSKGGRAYALEKNTTFQITSSSTSQGTSTIEQTNEDGNFNVIISTNPYGGMLGKYTIHATSLYFPYFLNARQTFQVILIGDITGDAIVEIEDVAEVSAAYGSMPPSNPTCDLNKDGVVDIEDVAMVCYDYGKYGTLP
ncbi:MAG: hypothetical protein QXD73_02250 [Candidatus Bathyarchaeia archaeon]